MPESMSFRYIRILDWLTLGLPIPRGSQTGPPRHMWCRCWPGPDRGAARTDSSCSQSTFGRKLLKEGDDLCPVFSSWRFLLGVNRADIATTEELLTDDPGDEKAP